MCSVHTGGRGGGIDGTKGGADILEWDGKRGNSLLSDLVADSVHSLWKINYVTIFGGEVSVDSDTDDIDEQPRASIPVHENPAPV